MADVRVAFVFSAYGGTPQCIQLQGADGSIAWSGLTLTVTSPSGEMRTFTFPHDLPAGLAPGPVLLAVADFVVTPDFVLPAGFLFPEGGTIDVAGMATFTYGPLPLDGVHGMGDDGAIVPAVPMNSMLQWWDLSRRLPFALQQGTDGNDMLSGEHIEWFDAGAGDDVIAVANWSARPVVDGGAGHDTLVLGAGTGDIVNHFTAGSHLYLVTTGGSVSLTGVERIRFADAVVAFDLGPGAAPWQAAALLWAAFGEAPDATLLSRWVHEADAAGDITSLAQRMLDAYAPGADTGFLARHLGRTIFGRELAQDEVAAIVSLVGPGSLFDSDAHLAAFAAQMEGNAARVRFTGSWLLLEPPPG